MAASSYGIYDRKGSQGSQLRLFRQITAVLGCFYPKTSWCVLGFFQGQVCSRLATWRPWCCPVITGAPKWILYQKVFLPTKLANFIAILDVGSLALWCRVFSRFLVTTEAQASPALWCSWRQAVLEELRRELLLPIQTVTVPFAPIYLRLDFCIFMEHEMKVWNQRW